MNILFVCKWNWFRSKAAEAIFNKINTNKNFEAKSRGIFAYAPKGKAESEFIAAVKQACKNIGISISEKHKSVDKDIIDWSDYIIIVADDVPKSLFTEFKDKKILHWKLKDVYGIALNAREKTMLEIQEKIEKFLKTLSK